VKTGPASVFGAAASALAQAQARTPFERDLRRIRLVIARLTLALSSWAGGPRGVRPAGADSLLFAVALAVGLTPELLPMITTVTLSRGALRMAARKVIVKRLASIHDLGAMSVLCTDKTGTLTSAQITWRAASIPKAPKTHARPDWARSPRRWRRPRRARLPRWWRAPRMRPTAGRSRAGQAFDFPAGRLGLFRGCLLAQQV